ncbi:MAG: HEAT repeat domain-containing protein [Opitutaceae bacterium]
MTRETARELLTPYLDGDLEPATRTQLEEHLASDPQMQLELEQLRELFAAIAASPGIEPDAELRRDLARLIEDEKQRLRPNRSEGGVPARVSRFPTRGWLAAAAACLACGLFIGWQAARRIGDQGSERTLAEVESLRRDVEVLRAALLNGTPSSRSASHRLQTVSLAGELQVADPEIIAGLFATLDTDPSANVRIAALEALRRFGDEPGVREGLVDALSRQTDPLVQIALIGLLVQTGATEARAPLEGMLVDPTVRPVVKGAVQQGLTHL